MRNKPRIVRGQLFDRLLVLMVFPCLVGMVTFPVHGGMAAPPVQVARECRSPAMLSLPVPGQAHFVDVSGRTNGSKGAVSILFGSLERTAPFLRISSVDMPQLNHSLRDAEGPQGTQGCRA